MGEEDDKKASGCGLVLLYNSVFHRRNSSPRHSTSPPPVHAQNPKFMTSSPKRQRPYSEDASLFSPVAVTELPITAPQLTSRVMNSNYHNSKPKPKPKGNLRNHQAKPVASATAPTGLGRTNSISTELENIIQDYQRTKGSSTLVRASSGNVMVYGNLGNIRAPGAVTQTPNVPKTTATAKEMKNFAATTNHNKQHPTPVIAAPAANAYSNYNANTAKGEEEEVEELVVEEPGVFCRAMSRRLDPEELKEMGNEEYKKGRYAEAVALYDRAILIDPSKPSYWSNKAAALMSMGLLIDAIRECKEAVRIDPSYGRAHQRLATIFLRLGEAERAVHHYKLAKKDATSAEISQAKCLQAHLSRCNEARKLRDWHTVLIESQSALSYGANSAPQVLAAKAEALLALQRHEEAEIAIADMPKFDVDAALKFFGASNFAYLLSVQALVDMAAGRFEEAVEVSQRAAKLDPSNKDITGVARKSRVTATARSTGNDLFRASKFREALVAYGQGLEHDPNNAIILSNRAACLSKLGQWEKAIEDCNTVLLMRPSYSKARLRRADCYAKLERWDLSIQDYKALLDQVPGDEEVFKAFREAETKLKQQGQGTKYAESVPRNEASQDDLIKSPGQH